MAKKVKFLKAHWRHPKGEIALIKDEAANYYIRCGVAEEYKEEPKEPKEPKKTAPKK